MFGPFGGRRSAKKSIEQKMEDPRLQCAIYSARRSKTGEPVRNERERILCCGRVVGIKIDHEITIW
jgi:hypothetical protein